MSTQETSAETSAPAQERAVASTLMAPPRRRLRLNTDILIQFGVIAVLLAVWEGVARANLMDAFLLPSLSSVVERIYQDGTGGTLLTDLGLTLYRALVGFLVAVVTAVPLGILMARSAAIRWFFDPLISVGFPMPKIAFLPIFMLWFGIFDTSKIVMIAFSCFFPIVSAAYAGTLNVDKWVIWSARSFGTKDNRLLWEIILPMALPTIMTGVQIALPVALIAGVATEMLMGGAGIGGTMIQAGRYADSVGVFAGIVELAALGAVVVRAVAYIRSRLLAWHVESRH
ncbi:MAG TPA: ABC transporter permease [Stellaceae bacterium]|nr:ABC transporter permease [Stellaceae bacterium]